jgi:hypothetical protein
MAASNDAVECSICLSPLSQLGMDVFTTSCQHKFHFQCLAKNVQAQNAECPLCRAHLTALAQLIDVSPGALAATPSQNVPLQQSSPIPAQPTSRNSGLWTTLRKSFRRLTSRTTTTPARPVSNLTQNRPVSSRSQMNCISARAVSTEHSVSQNTYPICSISFSRPAVILQRKTSSMKQLLELFQIASTLLARNP